MGNALVLSPCFQQTTRSCAAVKLIFWPDGTTRILKGNNHIAGEIMFANPTMMVCHADSFFIGHHIPSLSIDDLLMPGQTYFVLPIERFACHVLSASSLSTLFSTTPKRSPLNFGGECPFQYLKGDNGRALIKVAPEFIIKMIDKDREENCNGSLLCSTPELKKHYEQLVGSKEVTWSPKLETISEQKIRYSPCRFIGLEWKEKEKGS